MKCIRDLGRLFATLLLLTVASAGLAISPKMAVAQGSSAAITPPANLAGTALSATKVKLSWEDKSDSEIGFRIERASDKLFANERVTFSVAMNVTTLVDDAVAPLTVYYYRAMAFGADNESNWSNIAVVMPPDLIPNGPAALAAMSPGAFQIELNWRDNSNNESGFRIERATNDSFTQGLKIFTSDANVFVCNDMNVPAGTYYFRVAAFNDAGESNFSNVATAMVGAKFTNTLFGIQTADVELSGFSLISGPFKVNGLGLVQDQAMFLLLADMRGSVNISKGAKMLQADGRPLTSLKYAPATLRPQPPQGKIIVDAFDFGPSGSTFSPALEMILKYDPANIAPGGSTANLQVGLWDGASWQIVSAAVNTDNNQIAIPVNRFSFMAILGTKPTAPAPFSASNLVIFPRYSNPGDTVLIQVILNHNGSNPDKHDVVLKLNSKIEETRTVSLDAHESTTLTFTLTNKPAAYYTVEINGLKSYFVVQSIRVSPGTSPRASPDSSLITLSPLPTPLENSVIPASDFTPEPVPAGTPTIWIIWITAIALLVVVSLLIFFLRK